MTTHELISVLQEDAKIIKQHLFLCAGTDQETPLRAYEETLKAIKQLSDSAPGTETKQPQEEGSQDAAGLLVDCGFLIDAQARHYRNYGFIAKCNDFIKTYGRDRFIAVLRQVQERQEKGVTIHNIYAYINKSLDNEIKAESGVKTEK